MSIPEPTVKNLLHDIINQLGISDRLERALYAINEVI